MLMTPTYAFELTAVVSGARSCGYSHTAIAMSAPSRGHRASWLACTATAATKRQMNAPARHLPEPLS